MIFSCELMANFKFSLMFFMIHEYSVEKFLVKSEEKLNEI